MISRRHFVQATAAFAGLAYVRRASASGALKVAVASNAVGAIVAAEGGALVDVELDRSLGPTDIRVLGVVHAVGGASRIKAGLLDDPRNAPRIGATVRKILAAADPAHAGEYDANHKAWTHTFVRKILAWNAKLQTSSVRGKKIADTTQRAALLEWAGAIVDPSGSKPPAALARAPRDAAAATLAGYEAYIDALVASLA